MAVVVEVILKGVSPAQYDAVRAAAGWIDSPPDGGLGHFTWFTGDECHNIDAWESEGKFNAFVENSLGPAMAKAGVEVVPDVTFHPAHEVFVPRALSVT